MNVPKLFLPLTLLLIVLVRECMAPPYVPSEPIRDLMIPGNTHTVVEWDHAYYIQNDSMLLFAVPDGYLHGVLYINQTSNDHSNVIGCLAPLGTPSEDTKAKCQFVTSGRYLLAKTNFNIFEMVKYTLWNETHGILTETVATLLDCSASTWNIVCSNGVPTTVVCPLLYADTAEVIISSSEVQISSIWVTDGETDRHVYDGASGKFAIEVHIYTMTLTIKPSCELGGEYELTSTAKSGTDFKKIYLEIIEDVSLQLYQDYNITKLMCNVKSESVLMSITWYKNDNIVHKSVQRVIGSSELLPNVANTEDGDIFVCEVQTKCGIFTSNPVIWGIPNPTGDQHHCPTRAACDCESSENNTVSAIELSSKGYTGHIDGLTLGVFLTISVILNVVLGIVIYLLRKEKKKKREEKKKNSLPVMNETAV
ncbi:uncharacterized protein LOC144355222 [Saccoglossus kowalevskii]